MEEWSVKDLEDDSSIKVLVTHNTEMGNSSVPGIQVLVAGHFINYEPIIAEKWAYAAKKAGSTEWLLEDYSWMVYKDTYIKLYLLTAPVLKARVEVKVRSRTEPVVKEYDLPFTL